MLKSYNNKMAMAAHLTNDKQVGRPRGRLSDPLHVLTLRVRTLIQTVHHGKVREASRLTGIPYPTLNELYVGRTVNPNLATLERLRAPYAAGLPEASQAETA